MKWFKHDVDMHTDLKIQALISKHGLEGYAIWNLCLELLGKEGHKGRLMVGSRWQEGLLKVIGWSGDGQAMVRLNAILKEMSELKLICGKSLKYGNLYIPKFTKRVDDYTARIIRTKYEQNTEKVALDIEQNRVNKNRLDKIRIEYIKLKGWKEENLKSDDYARIHSAIKKLLLKADNDEIAISAIQWVSQQKYCDWTMETVVKKFPDFLNKDRKEGGFNERVEGNIGQDTEKPGKYAHLSRAID